MSEQLVDVYDPAVKAFRAVPVSVAIQFIQSSKKVEAYLVANKLATEDQLKG